MIAGNTFANDRCEVGVLNKHSFAKLMLVISYSVPTRLKFMTSLAAVQTLIANNVPATHCRHEEFVRHICGGRRHKQQG